MSPLGRSCQRCNFERAKGQISYLQKHVPWLLHPYLNSALSVSNKPENILGLIK